MITIQKFIETLQDYYRNPIRGTHAYCRFFLQASTFSFEIHDSRKVCFVASSTVYRSEVYWWGSPKQNSKILKDIRVQARLHLKK